MTLIIIGLFLFALICFIWANKVETDKSEFDEVKDELESMGLNLDGAEPHDGSEKMMWVAVPGHEICPDCLDRAGQIKTLNQWTELGLPGDGKTACGTDCYCILDTDLTRQLSPRVYFEKNEMKKK